MKKRSKNSVRYLIAFGYAIASMALLFGCGQEETTVPVRKNIEEAVFASGHIEQEHHYTVSAKVEGILLSIPIKEGNEVAQNDLIAIIENDVQNNQLQDAVAVYQDAVSSASPNAPQLASIQTQIDQAEQQLAFDKENYTRYKGLWEKKSVSQLEFEKAELQYKASLNNLLALEKNYGETQNSLNLSVQRSQVQVSTQKSLLKDYKLTTGASGKVINVFKKQGELIRKGEALARIGSGAYIIKLFVSEDDITKVTIGQLVAVHINTYPDQRFSATITKIYPGFDEAEQSYIVEAQFDQLPEKMFYGTQLQANIETGSRNNVVVIPREYISKGNFVMLENGEEKQIETGSKNNDWIEVVSGLPEGAVLVKPKS
ncbi:MAG: HlyD family efflux transporter periplasmic adaptor subunit [Bacteroidota bacterium]